MSNVYPIVYPYPRELLPAAHTPVFDHFFPGYLLDTTLIDTPDAHPFRCDPSFSPAEHVLSPTTAFYSPAARFTKLAGLDATAHIPTLFSLDLLEYVFVMNCFCSCSPPLLSWFECALSPRALVFFFGRLYYTLCFLS